MYYVHTAMQHGLPGLAVLHNVVTSRSRLESLIYSMRIGSVSRFLGSYARPALPRIVGVRPPEQAQHRTNSIVFCSSAPFFLLHQLSNVTLRPSSLRQPSRFVLCDISSHGSHAGWLLPWAQTVDALFCLHRKQQVGSRRCEKV